MADYPLTWPPAASWRLDPPEDHYYASALWLCGRHPVLVALVERVDGAVSRDDDGSDWFELDELAAALDALDAHRAAWDDYERTHRPPHDDAAYDAWQARGPKATHPGAESIGVMSRTEVSRLRLLAFFVPPAFPGGRRLSVSDLSGFDDEGRLLLHDWTLALLKA